MPGARRMPVRADQDRIHRRKIYQSALKIVNSGVTGLVTTAGRCYSGVTRYPDGGGLTAAERARREQVRLAAELIEPYRKETR